MPVLAPTPRSAKFVSPVRLPLCDVAPLIPAPLQIPFTKCVNVFAVKPSLRCVVSVARWGLFDAYTKFITAAHAVHQWNILNPI
jgi:hypothetical protein